LRILCRHIEHGRCEQLAAPTKPPQLLANLGCPCRALFDRCTTWSMTSPRSSRFSAATFNCALYPGRPALVSATAGRRALAKVNRRSLSERVRNMAKALINRWDFVAKIELTAGRGAHYYHFSTWGYARFVVTYRERGETVRHLAPAPNRSLEVSTFPTLLCAVRLYGYTLAFANCRLLARD
jgi:hypothetical protein